MHLIKAKCEVCGVTMCWIYVKDIPLVCFRLKVLLLDLTFFMNSAVYDVFP